MGIILSYATSKVQRHWLNIKEDGNIPPILEMQDVLFFYEAIHFAMRGAQKSISIGIYGYCA